MYDRDQMSALEVAVELMRQKKRPQHILNLLTETLQMKGLDDPDGSTAAQLYLDITSSALFVFCGNGEWDLKARQPLELWDKDGSSFSDGESIDDDDDLTLDDYELDDEEDFEDDYDDEEDDIAEDYDIEEEEIRDFEDDEEDDVDDSDYIDEEEYNEIMDDYEDMYEDK